MNSIVSILLGVVGVCVAGSASLGQDEMPKAIAGQHYKLVKNWTFSKDNIDQVELRHHFFTRYVYDSGRLDHLNDEWERYSDNANHILMQDALGLVARLQRGLEPGGIQSGMIRSKWTGQFGYYETSVKVPRGRGLWSAFWLNPDDGVWPPEIDVFEIVDGPWDSTKCSFHFLHSGDKGDLPATYSRLDRFRRYCPGWDYGDGFHKFAILWTPGSVDHYVDDSLVVSRPFIWRHGDGSSGGPAHLLLNLAVGGKWAGNPLSAATFPAALEVRYIRVWQKSVE